MYLVWFSEKSKLFLKKIEKEEALLATTIFVHFFRKKSWQNSTLRQHPLSWYYWYCYILCTCFSQLLALKLMYFYFKIIFRLKFKYIEVVPLKCLSTVRLKRTLPKKTTVLKSMTKLKHLFFHGSSFQDENDVI